MKVKKQLALNKLFNFFVLLSLLFAAVAISACNEGNRIWTICCAAASLLLLVIPSIFTPCCYLFDSEGVSLRYVFMPEERYLWKDVHAIEVDDISSMVGGRASVLDLVYAYVFTLHGKVVGKKRFYMTGRIRKSFRTKHLLEKYWDGTITGYVFEDVKKWYNKRKRKKQAEIDAHFTDEIVRMERELRAKVREHISPLRVRADKEALELKTSYVYVTADCKHLNSRPDEGYTYTLVAELSRFNESDESRIAVLDVELLHVRVGKTAYRGVESPGWEEALELTLSDALDEISTKGIDAYFAENN